MLAMFARNLSETCRRQICEEKIEIALEMLNMKTFQS